MTTIFYSDAALSRSVTKTIDRCSRYWSASYEAMTVAEIQTNRREGAIKEVATVLAERYAQPVSDFRTIAELILDNSEWGIVGFETRMFIPRNSLERCWAWLRS